jgi:hypothetical protein
MNNRYFLALAAVLLVAAGILPVSADTGTSGVEQGWYVIHCNVYGAKVYIDDKYVGSVPQGALSVQVATNVSYKTIRVQKNGYSTFTDAITTVPDKGESVDLYVTLAELPDVTATSTVGSDVGWYVVHCNIDGATVVFDSVERGMISQGVLYIPVYSAGTPYQRFSVKKDGYSTFTGYLANTPGKGETIDLYATLNPATGAATAAATAIPSAGANIGFYRVHCNVNGSTVSFDNDPVGQVAQGTLIVRANLSATPYRTFTVYKAGYLPYTGTVDQSPVKGGTIDLYATLNSSADEAAAATTQKSAVPAGIVLVAVVAGAGIALAGRK